MLFYLILLKDVNLFVGFEVKVFYCLIVFKIVKRSILVHSQLSIPHYIMPVLRVSDGPCCFIFCYEKHVS